MTTAVTPDANNSPAPTEEQVKAANEAEKAKWEPDFKDEDLKIPYKREEDNADKDDAAKKAEENNGKKEEDTDTKNDEEVSEVYNDPAPVVTVEDPGEYTPADYSFEIEIDGKKYKVDSPEKADELAEEHAEKLDAKALGALVRKGAKMELAQERDQLEWQKKKDAYDKQAGEQASRIEYVTQVEKEVQYLVDSGLLPKITDPAVKQRWETDPKASLDKEFIKNEGVKEQIELLNRLAAEREKRAKAGLSPLVSAIDVMKDIQLEKSKTKEDEYAAGEQRKAASSKVAGVSSTSSGTYAPKGVAVGRVINFRDSF